MTTPRDLLIVTMDMAPYRSVERSKLSLALAGAELIDLLADGIVRLGAERRIAPVDGEHPSAEPVLAEAAEGLVREPPYEPVDDWLWRRGRGLSSRYLAALEKDGQLVRQQRHHRMPFFRTGRTSLVDSPDRSRAAARWTADEPVLAALATTAGIHDKRTDESPRVTDDAVATVLAALDDACDELSTEAWRRAHRRDDAAVTNVQRGY
ncbi:GPP34 family phosphoprotein [Streptomyces sp. NPDC088725]|uniref:GOLPH3/VPS74 family protein n=1 Tax=Streptomyces sp. NPDC088725 TaxID=3365873 RepID=UPI003811BEC3